MSSTPPNWPIHGVHCNTDQASHIARHVFPNSQLASMRELDKAKSFNNRIYFLTLTHANQPSQLVLKLPGRFFGSDKIQNEVAVLLLLQKYCPGIPAPRVLAWSNDGSRICAIQNGVFVVLHDSSLHGPLSPPMTTGWIMLSKLPGRPLLKDELKPTHDDLLESLADHVSTWRRDMPKRDVIGNLRLQPAGFTSSHDLYGLESVVQGTLFLSESKQPLNTPLDYYNHALVYQIDKLHTNENFLALADIIPRLEHFRKNYLPKIVAETGSIKAERDEIAIFTHQDLAPRNVLVVEDKSTGSGLRISGILDFEFAGFFPEEEEFLVCMARQADDWEEQTFARVLTKLWEKGVGQPCGGIHTRAFKILCDLVVLVETIAPWQLEKGHVTGEELRRELEATRDKTIMLLDRLEKEAPTE